ncbi:hypothetical protein AB4Y45_41310 [Paraburkholderia sp. EG287A]|uniref:hypothetical protein n=1 Tax=unclassified Paraburkholderia TaxID=2615204 RepID=UPI0034D18922
MPRDQMSGFAMCVLAVKALFRNATNKKTNALKFDHFYLQVSISCNRLACAPTTHIIPSLVALHRSNPF